MQPWLSGMENKQSIKKGHQGPKKIGEMISNARWMSSSNLKRMWRCHKCCPNKSAHQNDEALDTLATSDFAGALHLEKHVPTGYHPSWVEESQNFCPCTNAPCDSQRKSHLAKCRSHDSSALSLFQSIATTPCVFSQVNQQTFSFPGCCQVIHMFQSLFPFGNDYSSIRVPVDWFFHILSSKSGLRFQQSALRVSFLETSWGPMPWWRPPPNLSCKLRPARAQRVRKPGGVKASSLSASASTTSSRLIFPATNSSATERRSFKKWSMNTRSVGWKGTCGRALRPLRSGEVSEAS